MASTDRDPKRRKLSHSPELDDTRKSTKPSAARSSATHGDSKTDNVSAALAGGSFKSNFFKLQVEELLKEIRPRSGKRERAAEKVLHKLKADIEMMPARPAQLVMDAERDLITRAKISVPFPNPRPPRDARYKLRYEPPANINVVGSYALQLGSKHARTLTIDMLVTMPAPLFEDKDYINYRYFYKRAYYLACIAAGLKEKLATELTMEFHLLHGDFLRPILVVRPTKVDASTSRHSWQIKILPSVAQNTFAADKLLPAKNAVRDNNNPSKGDSSTSPTPFYNSSVQADSLYTAYMKALHVAATSCNGFKDACLLGRTWLAQRGHSSSVPAGGFGHFEFAIIMATLLRTGGVNAKPALSPGYTSYQLFKATLQYLASKNFAKQPFVADMDKSAGIEVQNGQPMFFDGSRKHNVLFKMTPWSYRLLRLDARTTISTLGDISADGFEATFISKVDLPHLRFDTLVTIPTNVLDPNEADDHLAAMSSHKLNQILVRGLGDRATLVMQKTTPSSSWELGMARPSRNRSGICTISVILDPAHATRAVDHGPPAENKQEAAAFREFWGDKAELRRFKDGSILESLVWSRKEDPSPIVEQIIRHLISRHFGDAASQAVVFHDQGAAYETHEDSKTRHQALLDAFKNLENDVRGLEGLPLSIRQISATDAKLRSTSTDDGQGPMKVIIQFESSARWPDDLTAIQRIKIAFMLKLGEMLEGKNTGITCHLGLENGAIDIVNQAYLDIHYNAQISFRVRINADKEQGLIEKALKDKSAAPQTREDAAMALSEYKRLYMHLLVHTQLLQKLTTHFPTLSSSIKTTKRWFAAHLLHSEFSEELIEMLVLRTYTCPWPYTPPTSGKTGFLRTLEFLSRWDWRTEPLIVPTSTTSSGDDVLSSDGIAAMRTRFDAWRALDPTMSRVAIYVASTLDTESTWTTASGVGLGVARPSKLLAGRMSNLARAAMQEIRGASELADLDFEALFASPLTDYDFVLRLNPRFCKTSGHGHRTETRGKGSGKVKGKGDGRFKNLVVAGQSGQDEKSVAGLFVDELRAIYGHTAVFLHGDGDLVGGLWNPFLTARAWKVNLGYATRPVSQHDVGDGDGQDGLNAVMAEVDREGILGEIARIGGDLIEKIEVKTS